MSVTYREPATVQEAVGLLVERPQARIVAGGTDLVVAARSGKSPLPQELLAVHRLAELRAIEELPDGGLRIGALVTHADLESSSLVAGSWSALSDASALVGSPATRHAGTVGGNLCNASPAMELGSPLLVFEAAVDLRSVEGARTMPFASFVAGPGRTARAAGELLTHVTLPAARGRGSLGSAYLRLGYREAMEIAVVGAAALVVLDADGRCADARIALTAVASTCVRAPAAEAALTGSAPDATAVERAARAAVGAASPIDDVRATAEYRRAMVAVIVKRAVEKAVERARAAAR